MALKGEYDPITLRSMNNLAISYAKQGKYAAAELLLKKCLDNRILVLGENDPETLSTMTVYYHYNHTIIIIIILLSILPLSSLLLRI